MLGAISYPPVPIFEIGPLNLSLHGLFAGVGFLVGSWFMVREVRRRNFSADYAISALTWAAVGALIGIRLFTIPAHIGDPGYGIDDVFSPSGHYSILGGLAGGVLGGVLRLRLLKASLPPYIDMAAPGMALGTVVGRLGDLAIVEHLGSQTSFFLGYRLEPGYEIAPQHADLQRLCDELDLCLTYHHTALYDLLLAAALLGLLLVLRRRWHYRYGQLFAVYTIGYGLQRFVIDFARLGAARDGTVADSVMGPFTGSQWGALGAALLGVGLLLYFRRSEMVTPEQDVELGAESVPAG